VYISLTILIVKPEGKLIQKQVILANPRGFCAGVYRAISIVQKALKVYGAPVYVKHEVVHNVHVVDELRGLGAVFVEELSDVPCGSVLIYSAHGVSLKVRTEAAARELKILDATCPLVNKVHVELRGLHRQGYSVVMVGHRGHPEVDGTMGQVDSDVYLVESIADIDSLPFDESVKIAVVTQTTLSVDDTRLIIDTLKCRFPQIKLPKTEDICYATQNRQDAVKKIASLCNVLLVIGSQTSSNSNRLKELAQKLGTISYLIDDYSDINPNWLVNIYKVGVTAGASAPELLVQGVLTELKKYGFDQVVDIQAAPENITFALPAELRQ
jgi:4-hydroxy-3-methylbut-2-enyl diphosphate reductase